MNNLAKITSALTPFGAWYRVNAGLDSFSNIIDYISTIGDLFDDSASEEQEYYT